MRHFSLCILSSLALVVALAGCAADVVPAPSFLLRVRSIGTMTAPAVLLDSVGQLEVMIRPQAPSRFVELPPECSFDDCGGIQCCKYEGGQVSTFISTVGEYVIRFDGAWVRERAETTPTGFTVEVPIFATSNMDSPGALDPVAFGTVIRGTERIAGGAITLRWPLRGDDTQDLPVMCTPGFEAQCMNVDPGGP